MQLAPFPPAAGPTHVLEVIGNAIVGGMESCVERLIERLPPERFTVTALCPTDGAFADRLRRRGVAVVIVPMADDPAWPSIQTAISLIESRGIDVLHAHLPRAHVLAGLAGRLTGRPVMATIHGREPTLLDIEVHRLTGSHLNVVCQQSYFQALGLGVDAAQLSCVPNGVDTGVFQPRERGHSPLRESLGLPQDAPLVGFVGRLSPEKGPDVFARAAMLLHSRCPEAHAVIVGDGPLRGAIEALREQLGLQGCLHFAGMREDMPAVYGELDVLVSSSHAEAMPLALMEAMASGLPVVATRVGGVPDMVEPGETGWLVAPGDFNDMAGCCATLVNDPALRQRMGQRARQRAVERFDLSASVQQLGELLTQLAEPAADAQPALRKFLQQS